ncbi:glycine betaine ABC transporter substrate-binding protein [Microbacterium laevaniformans]|uniref:glycine betaine ABC transporter substrate-binding protein n=1 Tax=Microbacterium laevaniformans TaxID=36807 RepID=UPI0031EE805A
MRRSAGDTAAPAPRRSRSRSPCSTGGRGHRRVDLWQSILEDKGYDVKLTYADVAPCTRGSHAATSNLGLDTWLPTTHADYMKRYGDKVEDLGAWTRRAADDRGEQGRADRLARSARRGIRPVRRTHRRHRAGLGLSCASPATMSCPATAWSRCSWWSRPLLPPCSPSSRRRRMPARTSP